MLVRCPECIDNVKVRRDHLDSHIRRVHRKITPLRPYKSFQRCEYEPYYPYYSREYEYFLGHRGYTSEHSFSDTQSIDSQDWWSDSQENARTNVHRWGRDMRSPPTSSVVSDVSDSTSTNTTNTDLSDGRPQSSNKQEETIIFSTPLSVVSQRHSDAGYSCPVPKCKKRFAEVEYIITHVENKHEMERCLHCTDITFKLSNKLQDHIQLIHPNANRMSDYASKKQYPLGSRSNEGNSVPASNPARPATTTNSVKLNSGVQAHMGIANKTSKTNKLIINSIEDSKKQTLKEVNRLESNEFPPFQTNSQLPPVPVTAKVTQISSDVVEGFTQEDQLSTLNTLPHKTEESEATTTDHNSLLQSESVDCNNLDELERVDDNWLSLTTQDNYEDILDSFRDIELDNNPNFRFVNTGDLVGYSLNI